MAVINVDPQTPVRNYFPDTKDVQGSLGKFLYWYDFAVARATVVNQGVLHAVAPRDEAMVDAVVRANAPTTNAMTPGFINGLLASQGTDSDMFEGVTTIGVPSQFTAFVVLVGNTPDVVFSLSATMKLWNTKVDTGGGFATYATSAASGGPNILVVRWSASDGKVQSKVNDGPFEQASATLTTLNGNPTEVYVQGFTTGAGFGGLLGEVMISPDHMNFVEMNAVGQYLCEKWQISWTDITEVIIP